MWGVDWRSTLRSTPWGTPVPLSTLGHTVPKKIATPENRCVFKPQSAKSWVFQAVLQGVPFTGVQVLGSKGLAHFAARKKDLDNRKNHKMK